MSPEQQLSSDTVTNRSDLYSMGALMYELFVGSKPIGRFRLPTEVIPDLATPLEEIIMKCMDPDPKSRPVSADEIKDVLLKLLRGAHIETKQKERASESISPTAPKFSLLDVIKEEKYGSVYLYEENTKHTLAIIKKRPLGGAGYQETKLLASLKHKNIINIFGVSKAKGNFIIPMEYLSGGSLKERLVQPFPPGEFLIIAKEICEGLSFAHKNRVIHGNLRPSNVLFSDSGEVKVTDFALNEHYADEKSTLNWYNITGENITAQTDIFSAGVIFFQMLTGTLPAWLDTLLVENKSFKTLPERMQKLINRMLAHRRTERYKGFDPVLDEINTLIDENERTILEEQKAQKIEMQRKEKEKSDLLAKQHMKKRLRIFLLLFVLSAAIAAFIVYLFGDEIYTNALQGLFEKAPESPPPK